MKYAVDIIIYTSSNTLKGNVSMFAPSIEDARVWPHEYILEITKDIDGIDFLRISIKCKAEQDQIIIAANIVKELDKYYDKIDIGSEVKYHYCHADKITPGRCTEEIIWSN